MGNKKRTLEGAGRPHVNPNAIPHRELMKPGPKVKKLRIRFSPYQELARVPSKRKRTTNSSTIDPSLYSTQEGDQLSAQTEEVQPSKDLKVVQHHFSNGGPVGEQSNRFREDFVNEEPTRVDENLPNGGDKGGVGADSTHLTQRARSARRWKPARRLYREKECTYPYESKGGEQSNNRVLRPRKTPNYYPDDESSDYTSDEQTTVAVDDADKQAFSNKGVYSDHLCAGLACKYSGCHAKLELQNVTSGSTPLENQNKGAGDDRVCGNWLPGYGYLTEFEITNNDQHGSMDHQQAADQAGGALKWQQTSPMSMREMITGICEDVNNLAEAPEIDDRQAFNTAGQTTHSPAQDPSLAETRPLPVSNSLKISRIANGQVWESQATRKARARQELEATRTSACTNNTTTCSSNNTIDPSLSAYNNNDNDDNDKNNNHNSSHLDGPTSSTPNFTPTTNTFPVPPSMITGPIPTRFQNQDTHCLICLLPVTPSDILVSDLRCVACPRIFHQSCLTYIPPRINQNWRCSLCYREAWHGYGHLARERATRDPGLVERYRRRLLLANTYGGMIAMNDGLRQGGGWDGENVRFWFDVDMDGGAESDQAVLVRMGMVNLERLRILGDGDAVGRVKNLEEMERWGIALGMALQEEEEKVQALREEVGRLRSMVDQKDREIEELEGGL